MKLLLMPLMMLALPLPASADVSGTWNMSLTADWTNIPALVCKFSQNGEQLTGSCNAAGASDKEPAVQLTSGTVVKDRFSCEWRITTPDGQTWTYALTGIVDAKETTMKGSFTLSSPQTRGDGSFAAKKQS